jgi:DNA-binding response OmpR family regulator
MPRILIIDDQTSVLQALEFFFATEGYEVLLASNGPLALRLANETRVDIVMLDLEMPEMSGLDVCRAFKTNPCLAQVPVVIMTGRPTRDMVLRAQASGADLVLGKPFDLDHLRRVFPEIIAQAARSVPVPEIQQG